MNRREQSSVGRSEFDEKFSFGFVTANASGVVAVAFGLFDNDNPVVGNVFQVEFEIFCSHSLPFKHSVFVRLPWSKGEFDLLRLVAGSGAVGRLLQQLFHFRSRAWHGFGGAPRQFSRVGSASVRGIRPEPSAEKLAVRTLRRKHPAVGVKSAQQRLPLCMGGIGGGEDHFWAKPEGCALKDDAFPS